MRVWPHPQAFGINIVGQVDMTAFGGTESLVERYFDTVREARQPSRIYVDTAAG